MQVNFFIIFVLQIDVSRTAFW